MNEINITHAGSYHSPDALSTGLDPYGRGSAGPPGQTFGHGALSRVVQLAANGATGPALVAAREDAYVDGWTPGEIDHACFEGRQRAKRERTDAFVREVSSAIDALFCQSASVRASEGA